MRSQFALLICLIPPGCLDSRSGSRILEPDTVAPDTATPDTATPDTLAPDTLAPDTLAPDTLAPDIHLETVAPDTEPDSATLDTSLADLADAETSPATTCESPCTSGDTCHRDGYPGDEATIYYCAPPAQVGRSCTNQFNDYLHPCADGLQCLAPLPDDDDTVRLCIDCRPQDFNVTGECDMALGVFWDGQTCAPYSGCSCAGPACASPHPSLERCRAAVERPCSALSP